MTARGREPDEAAPGPPLTRREALGAAAASAAAALLAACGRGREPAPPRAAPAAAVAGGGMSPGRIRVRPGAPGARRGMPAGRHALGIDAERDTLLHVPATLRADRQAPLILTLHGAGGHASRWIERAIPLADALGALLVAPTSADVSWDARTGEFGADVQRIEAALAIAFGRFDVDPARLAIHGFSDGASYALSLGLTNGDLFGRIVAHSPGFVVTALGRGTPAIFVSHGTADRVLPIGATSRRIVPDLRRQGYTVDYREFDGGHAIPPAIEAEARGWLERGWG